MMKTTLRWLWAGVAALLSACGGGSLSTDQGNLRLVNATSEFAGLDLFADNSAVVTGVPPLAESGYGQLDAGTYTLDVRATGTSTALVTASATVARKKHQTVVAYSNAGTLAATVLSDEESDPSNGNAKLRIFNTGSASTDAVDVYLVSTACSALATSAAAPFVTSLNGAQAAYTQLAASTTPVHVCVTSPGDRTDLRLDIPSFTLSEKRIVTLVLVRSAGGVLLHGLVLDQQGALTQALNTSARVRVAASVAGAAPLSVDVNGVAVAAGLTTPGVSPYATVPGGTLDLKINGTTFTPTAPLTAPAGADVTLLVTGAASSVTLINDDNTPSSSSARPVKIRVVNGLNGATGTAALTVDNAPVGNGAAFAAASNYALVPSSAATARIEARTGATQHYLETGVTLGTGHVYSLFLLGDFGTPPNAGILVADR
jgi:uncharacterized protein DUF4397